MYLVSPSFLLWGGCADSVSNKQAVFFNFCLFYLCVCVRCIVHVLRLIKVHGTCKSEEVERFLIFGRNVLTAASAGQCTLMLSQAAGMKAVEDLEMFRLDPRFIQGVIKQDAERRAKKDKQQMSEKRKKFSQGLRLLTNLLHMVRCIFGLLLLLFTHRLSCFLV